MTEDSIDIVWATLRKPGKKRAKKSQAKERKKT